MTQIITTCAIDCPDNCGMIVHTENGRIVRIRGNPLHGYTRGYLCAKGYHYPRRVYSPDRVLSPQLRTSTGWKRISWDEALERIAKRIRFSLDTYGNGSIMHYWRTSSWGATKNLVGRLFNLLGGVTTQRGSLCSGSIRAAITADRGTYLALKKNLGFDIMVEGDRILLNIYHVIEVSPAQWPKVNAAGAKAFSDFMVSKETQDIVKTFGVDKYGSPLFFPDAGKKVEELGK